MADVSGSSFRNLAVHRINRWLALLIWGAVSVVGCGPGRIPQFVRIPGGEYQVGSRATGQANPPRRIVLETFEIAAHEVTVAQFADFLNATGRRPLQQPHPDLVWRRGCWRAAAGRARHPIASITYAEADAYCQWLSTHLKKPCRLPTAEEWEAAARGGIAGARWPWGWGPPEGRMAWNLEGARPVGSYAPNAFGLHDLSGNVFEWCANQTDDGRIARGGAWSERSSEACEVFRLAVFRHDYSGPDVGFRVAASCRGLSTSAR